MAKKIPAVEFYNSHFKIIKVVRNNAKLNFNLLKEIE